VVDQHIISFASPQIHSRHPIPINLAESLTRLLALLGLQRADKHAIRSKEIFDSGSLSEELGIGEDIETCIRLAVGVKDGAHGLCGPARYGRFLDDDL